MLVFLSNQISLDDIDTQIEKAKQQEAILYRDRKRAEKARLVRGKDRKPDNRIIKKSSYKQEKYDAIKSR